MKQILTNTWAALDRNEKRKFCLLLILDLAMSVLDILSLVFLFWIIRFYNDPGNNISGGFLPGWVVDKKSMALIGGFLIFFTLKNVAAYATSRAYGRFVSAVTTRISRQNLQAYQDSPFSDFVSIDSSVFIRRIAYRPYEFGQYILNGLQQVFTQSVIIAATVTAILIFNANLFILLLVILLPPVVVVFYCIKKRISKSRKNVQAASERSFRYLFDALKGYVEGNIYQKNSFFLNRFIHVRQQYGRELYHSLTLQQLPARVIEIFAVAGLFVLIAIANWGNGGITPDFLSIGAFMAAAYKIIPGAVKIINAHGQMKAFEFTRDESPVSAIKPSNGHTTMSAVETIEFCDVGFGYPQVPLLENVSFSVSPGDFVAVTGVSGKGKTTLFNLLLGFLPPSSGEVRINGKRMSAETAADCWPQVAYVRQQSFFIHDTILKNITLDDGETDEGKLAHAIAISGVDTMLEGAAATKKMITENGKNISGGQQQRIAIARALYKDAPVILLDEPFNELDEAAEGQLLSEFRRLAAEGRIVILVTHNRKSLAHCNKIISLDGRR